MEFKIIINYNQIRKKKMENFIRVLESIKNTN